jgi:di/tricarboxylate transporter
LTLQQQLIFAILLGMIGLFVWDRIRYDVVAVLALVAAYAAGLVPEDKLFSGFADPVIFIIASALVLSAAVGRSGLVQALIRPLAGHMERPTVQVAVLAGGVTFLSAFMKNIGALAIFLPIALQLARRTGTPASRLLMPLSFGSLLGGLMTLIGTSPNIIVSRVRQELTGEPFRMFDFFPVGVGLAVIGVAFLAVGWRLLPWRRAARVAAEDMFRIENYTSELHLPAGSPMAGRTVADLEALGEGDLTVAAIIREKYRRHVPQAHWVLYADDVIVVESNAHTLQRVVASAGLELVGSREVGADRTPIEEYGVTEAVIAAGSPMVGCTPAQLRLRERHGVNILAVGGRSTGVRLRRVKFRIGDVIVVQGNLHTLPETLQRLGCLPLAERRLDLGRPRQALLPAAILAATMLAVSLHLVPVAVGFLGAALLVALLRVLTLEEIYGSVEWPILVLFGALIPVSEAVRTTGATDLVAGWLTSLAGHLPPTGAVAMMMLAAMAVTPFLNNAATVLVMGPIGAGLAGNLGLKPDAFLMAVAIGAACDFLTPIGHQCNTLVMGPGGYRFGDYARLGLPLSFLVVVIGVPLIAFFWPLS